MKKATVILASDLKGLKKDKDGDYIIPDHIEIYIKETPEEMREARIAELEAELAGMNEPTEEELIEEGKIISYYFMLQEELNYHKNKQ